MTLAFTVIGAPRTKKTSNRVVRAGRFLRVLPSAAFVDWERLAVPQMRLARRGAPAIVSSVHVRAVFYRDANRGDMTGYMQALADALQTAGVLADDKHIASWDGTRLEVDRGGPRVEVEISDVVVEREVAR